MFKYEKHAIAWNQYRQNNKISIVRIDKGKNFKVYQQFNYTDHKYDIW